MAASMMDMSHDDSIRVHPCITRSVQSLRIPQSMSKRSKACLRLVHGPSRSEICPMSLVATAAEDFKREAHLLEECTQQAGIYQMKGNVITQNRIKLESLTKRCHTSITSRATPVPSPRSLTPRYCTCASSFSPTFSSS